MGFLTTFDSKNVQKTSKIQRTDRRTESQNTDKSFLGTKEVNKIRALRARKNSDDGQKPGLVKMMLKRQIHERNRNLKVTKNA